MPTTFPEWKELQPPKQGLCALRLVELNGEPALFGAMIARASQSVIETTGQQHVMELAPIALPKGALPPAFAVPALFDMAPEFDLASDPSGNILVAAERFQGGSNALVVGEAAQGNFTVTALYQDFTDYQRPRFIRGSAKPGSRTTAVANRNNVALLAHQPLDPKQFGRAPAPFHHLIAGDAGLVIAQGAAQDPLDSALLLAKAPPTGSGALATGERPSTLALHEITQGKISHKAATLFGTDATYGFDADIAGNRLLVLGSTLQGAQLISHDLNSGKTAAIDWPTPVPGDWAASPSVLVLSGGKTLALAFFEGTGRAATGIRYAQLDLTSLG